jgi:hypothetical protein
MSANGVLSNTIAGNPVNQTKSVTFSGVMPKVTETKNTAMSRFPAKANRKARSCTYGDIIK